VMWTTEAMVNSKELYMLLLCATCNKVYHKNAHVYVAPSAAAGHAVSLLLFF